MQDRRPGPESLPTAGHAGKCYAILSLRAVDSFLSTSLFS